MSHLGLGASIYALNVAFSYRKRYIFQFRGQKAVCGEFSEFATLWDFIPGTGSLRLITPKTSVRVIASPWVRNNSPRGFYPQTLRPALPHCHTVPRYSPISLDQRSRRLGIAVCQSA